MSLERFSSKLPDSTAEQPSKITPEAVLEQLTEKDSLPPLTAELKEQLHSAMTQEQIIAYYVGVKSIGDRERRKEVLDTWIPKPKQLFHASAQGTITEFEPRAGRKRNVDDPPQIFATPSEVVATMMLAPGDDRTATSGTYDSGRTWVFAFLDTPEFRQADKGGYIYTLPSETFDVDPEQGIGLFEWTSRLRVRPVGEPKYYSSSLQAMVDHGVKVYPLDLPTFEQLQKEDPKHHSAILEKLTPLQEQEK